MPTALITGASSGLGTEFAEQLAGRGHDVVLLARSRDRLEELAGRLRETHGREATVLVQDLSEPDAARSVADELERRGIAVDVLVNNAGFGTCGRFEEIDERRDHEQLMVNVVALVGLTHALVPGMLRRGSGAVLNVGSTAGFQPSAYLSVYSSAKAFVLNFSLSLRQEYRKRGIKVTALCPGPVETNFFETIGTRKAAVTGSFTTVGPVVRAALRALDKDRPYLVPGASNFFGAHFQPRRPRNLVAVIGERLTRRVLEPSGGDGSAAARGAAADGHAKV